MRYVPLLVLVVAAGCVARAEHPDRTADDTIDTLYERFSAAYAAGDPGAVVALYTDDAYYLSGGEGPILHGSEALYRSFNFLAESKKAGVQLDIAFHSVDRSLDSNLAYDVGYYRLTSKQPDGTERTSVGKFTVVLKKQADGTWRFHVDSFSGAPTDAFPSD